MKKYLLLTVFCVTNFFLHAQILQQVKDINPTGNSDPWQLTVSNNKIFFSAHQADFLGRLWVTDGTEANTILLGPSTGNSLQNVTAFNNKVYFSFTGNDNNNELWVSNGTTTSTKLLAEIYPGNTGSFPHDLTVASGKLFFIANNADGERRLYVSDGTATGTTVLRNTYNDGFNGASSFTVFKNNILFISDNGTGNGYGLWQTDGITTTLLKADIIPGATGPTTAEVNGKLYLSATDNVNGTELWVTDGTSAGTKLVKNISSGDGGGIYSNGNPQSFIAYNGKAYFSASDGVHGQELWVTDGTTTGTTIVKDILPGSDGSTPYQSIVFNNKLFFATWSMQELWSTDGTEAGTQKIKAIPEFAKFAAIWNNTMYLISGSSGVIYQSDGTADGTLPAKVSNSASSLYRYYQYGSDPYFLEYKGDLYLQASCSGLTNGEELVKLTAGTLPLQLLFFTGERQKEIDLLKWSTTNEINTSLFIIEQSSNGISFSNAGSVNASGNTTSVKTYKYNQQSFLNPGGYYRLKMQDKDGHYTFSNIIQVKRINADNITAFYDAFHKIIVIHNASQQTCNWQLVSGNGAAIKKGASADAVITIPALSFAAGLYHLQYMLQHQNKTAKLAIF